jgi:class 3 adenylate cyclase
VNLAFRLAGLAARDGNAPILVSEGAAALAPAAARYGGVEEIYAKGRAEVARVRSAERA